MRKLPFIQLAVLLCLSLFYAACTDLEHEKASSDSSLEQTSISANLNHKPVPSGLLSLDNDKPEGAGAMTAIDQNLFGKFFADRAEFYIVRNPTNKLYHTKVKSMTMYYLDGRRSKTKYIMEADVVNRLIAGFGSFQIKGFDDKNRALIRSRKILTDSAGVIRLNKALDNYNMSWTFGYTQINYRVDAINKEETYQYTESLLSYDKAFRDIRREED